jgi:hypothetical protein
MQWVPRIPGELAFEHLARNAVEIKLNGRTLEDVRLPARTARRPRVVSRISELTA